MSPKLCVGAICLALLVIPGVSSGQTDNSVRLAQAEQKPGLFNFLFGPPRRSTSQDQQTSPRSQKRTTKPAPQQPANTRQEPMYKRGLFGRPIRQQQQQAVQTEPKKVAPAKKKRRVVKRKSRKKRAAREQAAAQPEAIGTEIIGPAQNVLVIGDFMAQALAKGLPSAFADNPAVRIVNAANGSSGLVRPDYYNWPTSVPKLLEKHNPDAIVVMIGGNDRQAIGGGRPRPQFGTEAWDQEYGNRVAEFAEVLLATGRPVLWAGLVPVRKENLSKAYSRMNTIYQEQLQNVGIAYIDAWNGFADDQGKFAASGPDVNGQISKLRAGDGLNFTAAGQRKLAFFVEDALKRSLMEGAVPLFDEQTGEGAEALRIGPMVSLEITASGEGRLSSFGGYEESKTREDGQTNAGPPIGRVDNYVWPRPVTVPADDFPAELSAVELSTP